MVHAPSQKWLFANPLVSVESKMISRLFIVLVLGGGLVVVASWNTGGDGSTAKASRQASQPNQVIMTVAIEPDWAPPIPAPVASIGRSSRERLIAQN
jgi:hypothetical protein